MLHLLVPIVATGSVRIAGNLFAFFLSVFIARNLGASESGVFYFAFTMVLGLSLLGRWGADASLLRTVAQNAHGRRLPISTSTFVSVLAAFVPVSLLLGLIVGATFAAIGGPNQILGRIEVIVFIICGVPAISMLSISVAALRGLARPVLSTGLEHILTPATTLAIGLGLYSLNKLSTFLLVVAYAGTTLVAAVAATMIVGVLLKVRCGWPRFRLRRYLNSANKFAIVDATHFTLHWLPLILLGLLSTPYEVGVFNACARLAFLTNLALFAVNSVAAPRLAKFFAEGNMAAVTSLGRQITAILTCAAIAAAIIFVVLGEHILLLFGTEFVITYPLLVALGLAECLRLMMAPADMLLAMSGHEKLLRDVVLWIAGISIPVMFVAVHSFGVEGAVGSLIVAGVSHRLILSITLWKRLGVILLLPRNV